MRKIRIRAGDVIVWATVLDNPTADAIWEALPFKARASRDGDEIYFDVPVRLGKAADARDVLEAGEIGYWPAGHAFCIFFGRTPLSKGNEIRAFNPVNVFARIEGDPQALRPVGDGSGIRVDRAEE